MNPFERARQWSDPANWMLWVLYRAPDDPRLLVPMRFTNVAWIPNVAHPRAVALGLGLAAAAVTPLAIAALLGRLASPLVDVSVLLWLLAVVVPVGIAVRQGGSTS